MPPPPDMASWLDRKYSILGQQAAGEYQRNVAEAGKIQAETGEVAPNAASARALQGAQRGLLGEEATDLSVGRYPGAAALGVLHDRLYGPGSPQGPGPAPVGQQPQVPQSRPGGSQIITNPFVTTQPKTQGPQSYLAPSSTDPLLDTNRSLASIVPRAGPLGSFDNDQFLRRGTSNVVPLRKGSASVRGKGGKSGGKGGGGQGLEQILPALMAASQTSQMGGGAAGPQAADSLPPPMAPGAASPSAPGMAKGSSNVMRYAEGTPDVMRRFVYGADDVSAQGMAKGKANVSGKAKGKAPGDLHRGLAAILPQLMAAMQGGGGGPPMAPGGAAPPQPPQPPGPPGMARGAASVMDPRSAHSAPGYPFGAGYLFGATAVPGQGSGTVDKVPAMLAPHEAVLNRAAADTLGRGAISKLNAAGAKRMGLR